jgi:hypothetical protein
VVKLSPTCPSTVIAPTLLESFSVNHSRPSGAAAIPAIPNSPGTGYSVIVPWGVILPTWRPASSVNQRLPSGPGLMSHGSAAFRQERKLGLVVGVVRVEPDDVVPQLLREPDVPVRAGGDERRQLADPRWIFGDVTVLVDHRDLVDVLLCEPERSIRQGGDVPRLGVRSRDRVLGDRSRRRDLPDQVREASPLLPVIDVATRRI